MPMWHTSLDLHPGRRKHCIPQATATVAEAIGWQTARVDDDIFQMAGTGAYLTLLRD